jgi:quercetin dioxygenase-like cupin family protein
MDIRKSADVTAEMEHDGTTEVYWLVKPGEMRAATEGGSLELVSEFVVPRGGEVALHSHPTHEYYFVTSGRATMIVAGERREIGPGDLVYTPPNTVHGVAAIDEHSPLRALAFAVAIPGAGTVDYS